MRRKASDPAARAARLALCLVAGLTFGRVAYAQESPYFVTYDHHMEEPGSLEVSLTPVLTFPKDDHRAALAPLLELEYGATAWWTTELYLEGQTTFGDSTLFTGYRWENRFRLFMREHWINPVFYVEFESLNGADKTLTEVVGFDGWPDQVEPNAESRREHKRELEAKLILSRDVRGWNVAANLIAEKNLAHAPWEFGYALGVSRPIGLAASPDDCRLCSENFSVGLELYGGVGEWRTITLAGTSHYLAPTLAWNLPNGLSVRFSTGFGLTAQSDRSIVRVGLAYEIPGFGHRMTELLR